MNATGREGLETMINEKRVYKKSIDCARGNGGGKEEGKSEKDCISWAKTKRRALILRLGNISRHNDIQRMI